MEKSSHYYAILALSLMSGIKADIARKIAYASQFVDDAKTNKISLSQKLDDPLFATRNERSTIYDIATAHSYFKISTFNLQSMLNNTCAFHFFPGGESNRPDGRNDFTQKMRCKENPKLLRDMIGEVAGEMPLNPIRLGMLLHVYADSFSHQGFSGLLCLENDIKDLWPSGLKKLLGKLGIRFSRFFRSIEKGFFHGFIPAYGHGKALNYPDIPHISWGYTYDATDAQESLERSSGTSNIDRYTRAFSEIREFLSSLADKSAYEAGSLGIGDPEWLAFRMRMFKKQSIKKKIREWRKFIEKGFPGNGKKYDSEEWLRESFSRYSRKAFEKRDVERATLVDDYRDKSWYAFIESVLWYKKTLFDRLEKEYSMSIPL